MIKYYCLKQFILRGDCLNSNIFIWRDKHMIRLAICDDDNENMSYMKEKNK